MDPSSCRISGWADICSHLLLISSAPKVMLTNCWTCFCQLCYLTPFSLQSPLQSNPPTFTHTDEWISQESWNAVQRLSFLPLYFHLLYFSNWLLCCWAILSTQKISFHSLKFTFMSFKSTLKFSSCIFTHFFISLFISVFSSLLLL